MVFTVYSLFKKVRKSYPLRPKSLYITEIGWGSDSKTAFGRGSEEGQAQAVKNIYAALVKHQAPLRLKGVHWFTWKDLPTTNKSCAFCYNNGFLNLSGGGKQALSAFIPFLLSHGYKNKSR